MSVEYYAWRLKPKARKNHAFCKRHREKYERCERSIFIAEGVNFYALLLYVLLQILRIKRGETVYLCAAGNSAQKLRFLQAVPLVQ